MLKRNKKLNDVIKNVIIIIMIQFHEVICTKGFCLLLFPNFNGSK